MSNYKRKWWLAAVVICCLTPVAFASTAHVVENGGCGAASSKNCQQVPEGGSAAIYLLAAGLTCFGAIFLRSRAARSQQS